MKKQINVNELKQYGIKEGQKLTLIYIDSMGLLIRLQCKFISYRYGNYAQYKNALYIECVKKRCKSIIELVFYNLDDLLIYDGWINYPKSVTHFQHLVKIFI